MGVVVVIRLFIDPLGYADSVIRRAWIVFAVLQFIGIACGMSAELFDRWGAQLWFSLNLRAGVRGGNQCAY